MRGLALLLALLLPAAARADCPAPPGQNSSARSLSDAPYGGTSSPPPCRADADAPGLVPNQGWAAERDPARMQVARMGTFLVTFGALALVTAGGFAICAKHDSDAGNRRFCHDATLPTLITGAASSALGLGALGISAFVLREQAPQGHASLAAGLSLRLAMDWGD